MLSLSNSFHPTFPRCNPNSWKSYHSPGAKGLYPLCSHPAAQVVANVDLAGFGGACLSCGHPGIVVWLRILKAIEELLSEERPKGAEVH